MEQREQQLEDLWESGESVQASMPSFFSDFGAPEWPNGSKYEGPSDSLARADRLLKYLRNLDV